MFGTCAGFGIRVFVPFSLRKVPLNEVAESFHEVSVGDTINVVPFTGEDVDEIPGSISLKYIPSSCG